MAKKKKSTPRKKAAPKKAAPKKKTAKKKSAPKKAAKKKGALRAQQGRPFCETENKFLGPCMNAKEARRIAKEHEDDNHLHVVGVESC